MKTAQNTAEQSVFLSVHLYIHLSIRLNLRFKFNKIKLRLKSKFQKDMIDFNTGQEMCTMENRKNIGIVSKC